MTSKLTSVAVLRPADGNRLIAGGVLLVDTDEMFWDHHMMATVQRQSSRIHYVEAQPDDVIMMTTSGWVEYWNYTPGMPPRLIERDELPDVYADPT